MSSYVDSDKLTELNAKVYEKGLVDREHLLEFLSLISTNDGNTIVGEVKKWLTDLHNDPKYSRIVFPQGHIDDVLGDLDSYGRVHPSTILKFKQSTNHAPPMS